MVIVNGKTGMRRVRLIFAMPYLSQWLESHPLREKKKMHRYGLARVQDHSPKVCNIRRCGNRYEGSRSGQVWAVK